MDRIFKNLESVVDYVIREEENCRCEEHTKERTTPEEIEMFKKIIERDCGVIFLFTFTAYMVMYDQRAQTGFERTIEGIQKFDEHNQMLRKS